MRAQVEVIGSYSAHADRGELANWLDAVRHTSPRLQRVSLVHGEAGAQDAMRDDLGARGYMVQTPKPRDRLVW